ncbi:hypothetical protein ACI2LC_17615 [Nonomuraea wenchangensis]|uniref:hypothetical protein n=1 Tax=Nonomuraea wenchangensis TaxID=568860 RepID=UPI0038501017
MIAVRYRVVGECVTSIPSREYAGTNLSRSGVVMVTLLRGSVLPAGVPDIQLRRLLSKGLIAPLEG